MTHNESGLLTGPQFRAAVGASRSTVWRAERAGVITGLRIGNQLVYSQSDVRTFNLRHAPAGSDRPTTKSSERTLRAQEVTACALALQTLIALGSNFKMRAYEHAERLEHDLARILDRPAEAPATLLPIEGTRDQIETAQ